MRVQVTTTLDDGLLEEIRIKAIKKKETFNTVIEEAIAFYLKEFETYKQSKEEEKNENM